MFNRINIILTSLYFSHLCKGIKEEYSDLDVTWGYSHLDEYYLEAYRDSQLVMCLRTKNRKELWITYLATYLNSKDFGELVANELRESLKLGIVTLTNQEPQQVELEEDKEYLEIIEPVELWYNVPFGNLFFHGNFFKTLVNIAEELSVIPFVVEKLEQEIGDVQAMISEHTSSN